MMSLATKFEQSYIPEPTSGCWLWTGPYHNWGYGWLHAEGKSVRAHVFSLERKLGRSLHPGYKSLHVCDVKECVNPDHLYEGTLSDNMRDREKRGKSLGGGGRKFKGKITWDIGRRVILIYVRERYSQRKIADIVGISQRVVNRILNGYQIYYEG